MEIRKFVLSLRMYASAKTTITIRPQGLLTWHKTEVNGVTSKKTSEILYARTPQFTKFLTYGTLLVQCRTHVDK